MGQPKFVAFRNPLLDINVNFKNSKCKGFKTKDFGWGSDFDCGYNTTIDCEDCKYGLGRKNPEAKCNKLKS